jgi:hypothetical protein
MNNELDKSISDFINRHPLIENSFYPKIAKIIVHVIYAADESRSVSYEWQGPDDGVVGVSYDFIEDNPDWKNELPWKMVQIENDNSRLTAYFQREEFARS